MRKLLFLAMTTLAVAPPTWAADASKKATSSPAPAAPQSLTAEDREACASELEVLEKRLRLFEGQGLSHADALKRNEGPQAALTECLRTSRITRAAEKAREADLAELDRRAGPDASEATRSTIWTQLRLERLSVKPVAELTDEERAELKAGSQAEMSETHATLDTVHSRDPAFMRMVNSSLACYHGVRRDRIKDELRHEEALLKLGQGSRQKVYGLKADLKQSDDVLSRAREAAKGYRDGLGKCTEEQVAVLAHCLAARFDGLQPEPACESEEIQQYIRFIK
jgi:hypothetical protein